MYLLRNVQDNDINLLKDWLQQDYVAEWFGDVEDWLLEIRERDSKYNFIQHFIVEDNQIPIGFVQYYNYNKIPLEDGVYNSRQELMELVICLAKENYLVRALGKY